MEIVNWKGIAESLLFAAGDEGLSLKQIAHVLEVEENQAREIMDSLMEDYNTGSRGIMAVELAGTFQLVTKKSFPHT